MTMYKKGLFLKDGHEDAFAKLSDVLVGETATIVLKWRVYLAMFGTNQQRVEMMNSVSGLTAAIIQDAIYSDVILSLCRLSDPASQHRNKNNSVARLVGMFQEGSAKDRFSSLAGEFTMACQPLRRVRNLFLAHADSAASLDRENASGISRVQIETAMDCLKNVIRTIESEANNTHIILDVVSERDRDEIAFMQALYLGQMKKEELIEAAFTLIGQQADPRYEPPESAALPKIFDEPEWLSYRPPERPE